ncbi:hypothetical protein GOBAR_DD20537 [Gossypium barbadense]|nr:hypothetical protein GOBAR_DD20537 [Gossypium barbadense]
MNKLMKREFGRWQNYNLPSSTEQRFKEKKKGKLVAKMRGSEITEEVSETKEAVNVDTKKKTIFVAGATGSTGKRVVEQLLSKGFSVKAGVQADVTEGSAKLAEAIGEDSDAVICATGFRPGWDLFAPWKVDNFGTVNLVEACRKLGVNRFILISSILVNGAAMGQVFNPAYIFLNVFGLTLIAKLQAEQYIRKSGINYTIIRPGGLRNDPPTGNVVMEPEVGILCLLRLFIFSV